MRTKNQKTKLKSNSRVQKISKKPSNFSFCFEALSKCSYSRSILEEESFKYGKKLVDSLFSFYDLPPIEIRKNHKINFEPRQSDKNRIEHTFRLDDSIRILCHKMDNNFIKLKKVIKKSDKKYFS
jgi:hypothetical protein